MAKEKEDKPLNIYQRINAVRKETNYIQKGPKGDQLKYSFVSHDAVTAHLQPFLVEQGIVVIPTVESHSTTTIVTERYEKKTTNFMTEILMNIRFVNMDNPSDYFEVKFLGFGIDPSDKGPGKAISYACKYALLKTFNLETGDDPDEDQQTRVSNHQPEEPKSKDPKSIRAVDITSMSKEEINSLPKMSEPHATELFRLEPGCNETFIENMKKSWMQAYGSDQYDQLPDILFDPIKARYLSNIEIVKRDFLAMNKEKTA